MNVKEQIKMWKDPVYRNTANYSTYNPAGDIEIELNDAELNNVFGAGDVTPAGLSDDNNGKWCTITWECSICPTLTCGKKC